MNKYTYSYSCYMTISMNRNWFCAVYAKSQWRKRRSQSQRKSQNMYGNQFFNNMKSHQVISLQHIMFCSKSWYLLLHHFMKQRKLFIKKSQYHSQNSSPDGKQEYDEMKKEMSVQVCWANENQWKPTENQWELTTQEQC